MGSIRKYFTWCISDISLCLSSRNFSTNSTRYTIGDSLCTFYLRISFDETPYQVSVLLCRCYDEGPTEVKVRFFLSLKAVSGYTFHTSENIHSFQTGDSKGFSIGMTKGELLACLANEYEKNTLIVICQTVLEPSFVFLSEDMRDLSANLLQLRSESSCANAHLIAGGENIPVHKEILSARSPVLQRMFETGDCLFDKCYPAEVVKAILDFLYSGDISRIDLDSLCPEQLYACAMHYEISDLIKLLTPKRTFITSVVDRKNEIHEINFADFTNLCRTRHSVEHHGIKMVFNEDIEMSVKLLFEPYHKFGKISLETTLLNLSNVKSILVRLFILDNSGRARNVDEMPLEPDNRRILNFCLEYESEKLFSGRNLILPKDILSLKYELQFRLTGDFHISDPEILEEADCGLHSHEVSSSLIKSMESLLKPDRFADAFLVLPAVKSGVSKPTQLRVHKSILSARSSVFKDKFRTDQIIYVDFPSSVVKYLLYYVYTGVLPTCQPGMLNLLHKAAETYHINPLKRACEDIARKVLLDTKNVVHIHLIATRAKLTKLKETCEKVIVKNKDIILGSFRWERLRKRNGKALEEIKKSILKS